MILLRSQPGGFEVFLLRRHKNATFMASSYVFPGGATEAGEDARTAAARELFEEAGVLLARDTGAQNETLQLVTKDQLRAKILAGAPALESLQRAGLAWATEGLIPWSHWITPSLESPRRFSARFFVGEMPPGQVPTFDATETVDQVWLTPREALARSAELALPPPQIRTFWELANYTDLAQVFAAARKRAEEPHPIMPRMMPGEPVTLLLPWDPDYNDKGTGEATPLAYVPTWAIGPSRFTLEDPAKKTWKHV